MNAIKSTRPDTRLLLEFLYRLGQAYLASGEQTAEVESILRKTAVAYGFRRPRVVAFPTAVFLTMADDSGEHITISEGPSEGLRLDQISAIYRLGEEAQRGEIAPRDGIGRILSILKQPPRFGITGAIGGHAILSVGLTMILMPTVENLIATAILGAIVGWLKLLNRNRRSLSIHMPVVASATVAALVFLSVRYQWPVEPLHVLVPPLVTFLPGARLTLGMVELAYGDMVSGSSRLITGFVQLLLLVLGLSAGAILVGYSPENLLDAAAEPHKILSPDLAAWLGVTLFAVGVFLHFSAPEGSLRWMLLMVLVAFAAQQFSTDLFSKTSSGFFGMLVVTPLSYLIQQRFRGPPAMVTFLPAFWILVPGALSLLSMKQVLISGDVGVEVFANVMVALVSIALGTLIGASLYKWVDETSQRRKSQALRSARRVRPRS